MNVSSFVLTPLSNCGYGRCRSRRADRAHGYKYALAYVVAGVCVLRCDNEAGKGDHTHIGPTETPYHFTTPDRLLADFWQNVDQWRPT